MVTNQATAKFEILDSGLREVRDGWQKECVCQTCMAVENTDRSGVGLATSPWGMDPGFKTVTCKAFSMFW